MAEILAVDDSESIRMMIEMAIDASGDHEVTLACDGREALDIVQDESFDLIITDINMPNMDGFELIKNLREMDEYKRVPIVCLTTENEQEVIDKGIAMGATGWLTKPFNASKLLKTIGRLI